VNDTVILCFFFYVQGLAAGRQSVCAIQCTNLEDKAIYHLTNNILQALDNNQLVGGLFCDLSKAFDYVNHDILLAKLEFYGVTGHVHKLITSYLKSRYQRVVTRINCSNSYHSE
jgi:hypothetical protein